MGEKYTHANTTKNSTANTCGKARCHHGADETEETAAIRAILKKRKNVPEGTVEPYYLTIGTVFPGPAPNGFISSAAARARHQDQPRQPSTYFTSSKST